MTITLIAENRIEYTFLRAEQKKLGRYPKTRICKENGIVPILGRPKKVKFEE